MERVIWRPQPGPQKALIDCPIPEAFFGGARGGGKTDGVIGKYALKEQRYGEAFNALFFRRELPMLDDAIERSKQIFGQLGGKWNDQKKTWRLPNGGRLRFRPLDSVTDADKYQGQNVSDACVEEAGQYPDPAPIDRLNGILRSAAGVPIQLLLTGNPGGAGQLWLKGRYVDPAPQGMQVLTRTLPNGQDHRFVFIPSKLGNNRMLLEADPDYINRLYLVGSEQLVKAWLDGDWSAIAGAYFDCWQSTKHVISPFRIPKHWLRFRSFDWGSAAPFSVQWWAVSDGDILPDGRQYPAGAIIHYREWYGAKVENGRHVGLKLFAEDVAAGIADMERGEDIAYGVADPACWKVDGGPSVVERMADPPHRIYFQRADNSRISGWDQMRSRMVGIDGRPMMYVFSTCQNFIRTVPAQQHDKTHAEDIDSDGEDHCSDSARYAAMSRPWTIPSHVPQPIRGIEDITMDEVWKYGGKQRQSQGWPERI